MSLTPTHITGFISIKGQDTGTFCQGQFTCDVLKSLNTNSITLGGNCNLKGRVQSVFYVLPVDDGLLLWLSRSSIPSLITSLKKYALFSKVTLKDVSDEYQLLVSDTTTLNENPNTQIIDVIEPFKFFGTWQGHLVECSKNTTLPALPVEQLRFHKAMIEAKIPMITSSAHDLYLPHHLRLHELGGVSFDKGCYLGQEIVARMHYKGQPKEGTYVVKLLSSQSNEAKYEIGQAIYFGNDKVGTIIDCCDDVALICIYHTYAQKISELCLTANEICDVNHKSVFE